jgi:ATP-binding cassette subfamily F protein 3
VVSHNRYFVNTFVNKVLEIKNGRATLYEGNVDDYLARRDREREDREPEGEKLANENGSGEETAGSGKKALRQQRAKERQKKAGLLAPLREELRLTEQRIEALEKRKHELETMMADPELYRDQPRWAEVSREYHAVERKLARLLTQWEEALEKIEAVEESVSG